MFYDPDGTVEPAEPSYLHQAKLQLQDLNDSTKKHTQRLLQHAAIKTYNRSHTSSLPHSSFSKSPQNLNCVEDQCVAPDQLSSQKSSPFVYDWCIESIIFNRLVLILIWYIFSFHQVKTIIIKFGCDLRGLSVYLEDENVLVFLLDLLLLQPNL